MNVQSLADGQVAASQTAILNQAIATTNYGPGFTLDPYRASINFANTSGSLSETVQLFVQREGGTSRLIDYAILAPHEVRKITGIPMNPGDTLLAQTTDATTVDYIVWGSADGIYTALTYTATGATKSSATTTGGAQVITSASANALTVGANGTTNPQFNVDDSTSSVATGLNIKGAAAGGGLAVTTLSSTTNEALTISAKGSGTLTLNSAGTGNVIVTNGLTTSAVNIVTDTTTGTSFGTATAQKISFYGVTPVVQPPANTNTATTAAGGTTAIYLNTTLTGGGTAAYTVGGVIAALKALGLLAA